MESEQLLRIKGITTAIPTSREERFAAEAGSGVMKPAGGERYELREGAGYEA